MRSWNTQLRILLLLQEKCDIIKANSKNQEVQRYDKRNCNRPDFSQPEVRIGNKKLPADDSRFAGYD